MGSQASFADGRANLCGNNRRFITLLFQIFTKPLNICSDFHPQQHFFGLVGGFFVGLSVTLWLGMTLGGGYSMT